MTTRTETGRMQVGADWPGIFIRGDDALGYAQVLHSVVAAAEPRASTLPPDELRVLVRVRELAELLETCRA